MSKVVLVTGGSRGIGRAICKKFASEGYSVAINYEKSEKEANCVAKETGGKVYRADVSDYEQVFAMVDRIESELGEIDVLINNAAISVVGLFQDMTDNEWERIFGVNVKGVFNCSKCVLKNMLRKRNGSIVNISSMWGITGGSCESHYSATKAAVIGYTKALAKELGPSGIRVNCVAPGTVNTEMNAHLSGGDLDVLCEDTPLCKIGSPEEIAEAVYFLASEKASFITGEMLNVNGGYII